ncbi:MAG: tetratricopeptide repeat protein, partial [Candidatus Altiarchaeota archaeon]
YTLSKRGEFEKAITDATKAIELDPENKTYYISRGHSLFWSRRYVEALSDYSKAISSDPYNSLYYVFRGNTYAKQKLFDDALRDYETAIELDPTNLAAYEKKKNLEHVMHANNDRQTREDEPYHMYR